MGHVDYAPVRTMAFGIAGLSVVADSLSAVRYAKVRVIRDGNGLITDYKTQGDFPKFGNNDNRVDHLAAWVVTTFMNKLRKVSHLSTCDPHAVRFDNYVQRGLRQEHRQHARRSAARRAVRPGCESNARTGHARHPCCCGLGRKNSLS